jgi:hypothetical protein
MCRVSVRPVRACIVRSYYYYIYRYRKCSSYFILHFSHPAYIIFHTCTSFQFISSDLFSSHFISSYISINFIFFISSEYSLFFYLTEISLNLSRLFYTSEPDFILQGLYKIFPIILYYKIYTTYFPILFCITKFK